MSGKTSKGGRDHSIQCRSIRLRRLNFSEEDEMERPHSSNNDDAGY